MTIYSFISYLKMKTTKSWKEILGKWATYWKQVEEASNATNEANKQIRQVKTFWLFRYVVVIVFLVLMFSLMYFVWFIVWDAVKDCPTVSCPVIKSVCELPKTGATF